MLPNLRKWHRENRKAFAELTAILAVAVLLFWASGRFAFAERFYEFCREFMAVGQLIVVTIFLSIALSVFSMRRWLDLRRRIWLANTDGLTGLNNKRRFIEILETEIARSQRHRRPLSLIMFDLDWFKKVNDQFGHGCGDDVLRSLADVTRAALREFDSLARWGGDEFVIIATETDLQGAINLAERLRRLVESHTFRKTGAMTASFGVAEMIHGESMESFLQRVDRHLYRAKESGRNNTQSEAPKDAPAARGRTSLAPLADSKG